jgi:endoglucanase
MVIADLSLARGISGHEAGVRRLVQLLLPPGVDRVVVDPLGNLLVGQGLAKPGPTILFAAHMDEVGMMVTGFRSDGQLLIRPVGGVDATVIVGKRVLVGQDALVGVIGLARQPGAQAHEKNAPALRYDDLAVDIGARDRAQAERWARLGAMVTFDTAFSENAHTYQGKALDDRVGCFVGLQVLAEPAPSPRWVAFTVQEELGLRGARVLATSLRPDLAIILEGTVANDVPTAGPGQEVSRIGGGAVLSVLDRGTLVAPELRAEIGSVAAGRGLAIQDRRTTGGQNDSAALWPHGVRAAAIAAPCRYIHSPCAITGIPDVEAMRLLAAALSQEAGRLCL